MNLSDRRASSAESLVRNGRSVLIHDATRYPDFDMRWLERDWWQDNGARAHTTTGRGSVLMLDHGDETWVYRHYHRGGFVSRVIYDEYVWTGIERCRPIREWRVLSHLSRLSLPAPRPVAARAVRAGLIYRADIITVLLPATRPLSSVMAEAWSDAALWPQIGSMVARFHAAGCDHPDLTAHNILVDAEHRPYLVDFDNATLRSPGRWQAAGIARLKRSLLKVALETGSVFDEDRWRALVAAYSETSA